MPTYQYVCSKCNTHFELKQSFNDESVAHCPQCKAESRRLFNPVPIIFKGSGFYVTDSKSTSAGKQFENHKESVTNSIEDKDSKDTKTAIV